MENSNEGIKPFLGHKNSDIRDVPYVFDRMGVFEQSEQLKKEFKVPLWFGEYWWYKKDKIKLIFNLGGSLQGLSFHAHQEAWNELVVGIKRWSLMEPVDGTKTAFSK